MYRDATETGSIEFSAGAVEARLVPLTFPPLPPSSPALRERKGGRRESMLARNTTVGNTNDLNTPIEEGGDGAKAW